ncbi:hypothetical protein [Aeromonas caviae]|uniref:hypothetical protein n=1 Tax=Aeromonas caviae TaxID=648 RepID=UPI00244354E3|nr:hypothetical protein [Aeromonas caviae]
MSNAATPRRAFGLIWRCAALVGRIHPLKVRKRIQKRATSCEVALSKRLGWGESESIAYVVDFKWFGCVFFDGGVAIGVTGD